VPKISARNLREHRSETTERLIEAFAKLVMERGFAEVSLADVASEAGIARTAIYNYFPDREALLFAWTDREMTRTLARLEAALAHAPSAAAKLKVFVKHQLEEFESRHLPPGREVMQLLQPETFRRFMEHIAPIEGHLSTIVTEGMEAGEFAEGDPAAMIQMILACIGSERAPLATKSHTVKESTDRVTSFILRALGAAG